MKGAGTTRLFLALWPDDDTRAALVRWRDAGAWGADTAPESVERLHLTLHFLGAVPQRRLPVLIDGLRVPCRPFTLRLQRTQRWPNGVAALTPHTAPRALLALHAALRNAIEGLDMSTETRRWRPHVTLARYAGDCGAPAQTSPVDWHVNGYALVESHVVTKQYLVLQHYR